MQEMTMPAAEAETVDAPERFDYELAFHVLPTVAEGEVATVFEALKDVITKNGGELTDEEAPERFDLAYEIVKHLEGKNRKFASAYFGWVRFTAAAAAIEAINDTVDERGDILRHMVIRLNKAQAAHPFRFHEALESQKMVTDVEEAPAEVAKEAEKSDNEEAKAEPEADTATEEAPKEA